MRIVEWNGYNVYPDRVTKGEDGTYRWSGRLDKEYERRDYIVTLWTCAGICMLILVICVHYLQLQTLITRRMKEVAALESELTQLKEDNDAYYSQVTSDIDLSEIKKIAIGRLGMKYPAEDQIMTYETEGRSYVRQFQDVPGAK